MPSTQEMITDIYHKLTGLAARVNTGGGGAGNHNLLSATHPDTDPATPPTRGSLIRASAGNEWQEYAIGAAGRYLRSDGADPSWAAIPDEDVILDILGAATYDNLHEYINNVQSAARISGGAISDSGGGEIDVAAGKGILKTTDDEIGANVQFDWSAETNIVLANNETTWVGIQYNPGPQVKTDTDLSNFNFNTDFILGRVYRSGATLYILNAGSYYSNFQHRVCYRIFEVDHFRRATGGIIADEGNLDFSISQGAWYCGTTRYTTAVFDCSGADRFTYWYRDGGGGWTALAAQADINNLNYDDGVPPLGALGVGRYGVHWVYLAHDGSVHVQYGQGNYKHFEAEAALVPDGPDFFVDNCVLVGKIIVGQNDATFTDVLSSFETIFIGQAASIHNDLGGLQGGQADEYYHLTATEHGYISGVNAQSLLTTASVSFAGIVDTGVEATNLAAGTIGQRPGGIVGDIRYNSTLGVFEVYTGAWGSILLDTDVGIADNDILSVDGVAAANDYAKFTASGLVGRSYDEVLADLSGEALAAFDWNAQNLLNMGTGHDAFTDFDANKHIDHTAVTLTAGEGLAGGGTIAANRTFDLDINGLVEDAAGASGDFFVYYDTVAGDHKKIDWDDMPGGGGPWTIDGNDIYWDGIGHVTIGALAPDSKMTTSGFNIYTAAASDTLHFCIQNADVSHGFTSYADADTYLAVQKHHDSYGGVWIAGFSDVAGKTAMRLWGLSETGPTGAATSSVGCIDFCAAKRSGTIGYNVADTSNCFAWINWNRTIMLLKGRGDLLFPDTQCRIFLGDSINTFMDSGITINQKGYDNEILTFKGNDINHGMTTKTEFDTYGYIKKRVGNVGGVQLVGLSEITIGIELAGGGATDVTTKNAASTASIILNAIKKSGSTFGAVGANGNLVAIRNNDSSLWIADAEGDVWQNGVLHIPNMKSGANQGAAGAATGELWHDTGDNTVKMGV